jgi:hypothetical protein
VRRRAAKVAAPALAVAAICAVVAGGATLPGVPKPTPPGEVRSMQGTASDCAALVVDDWVDDGLVQGTYRLQCYRDAIDSLPEDMRAYSSAPDDLERALMSATSSTAAGG